MVIGAAVLALVGFLVFSGDDGDDELTSGATTTVAASGTALAGSSTTLAATTVVETSTSVGTTLAGVPGEIFLEPSTGVGPIPFTPSVDATPPDVNQSSGPGPLAPSAPFPADSAPVPSVPGAVQAVPGNAPGLYGGTRSRTSCDKERLVSFLEANPDKAAAWAAVQQIQPAEIREYVEGLTPVLLRTDTRVTNYGFENGKAPARQVVLQAGTAVLVDEFGVPRARCFCGNPLREPQPEPTPTYTGDAWQGFDPADVTVVSPSPEPVEELIVVDVASAEPFVRPVGSDGAVDAPAPPDVLDAPTTTLAVAETTTTTIAATTTTVAATTTTTPVPPADITSQGSVEASSEFPGNEFPASEAVDGDATTSWFSAGPGPDGTTVFRWVAPDAAPVRIAAITIVSNALHPDFPTDFGFGRVTVEVQDANLNTVFTQSAPLDGTPDPTVVVNPDVAGSIVVLTFTGHEALDCGGFAELIVEASPA